jgi:hypothetical protein
MSMLLSNQDRSGGYNGGRINKSQNNIPLDYKPFKCLAILAAQLFAGSTSNSSTSFDDLMESFYHKMWDSEFLGSGAFQSAGSLLNFIQLASSMTDNSHKRLSDLLRHAYITTRINHRMLHHSAIYQFYWDGSKVLCQPNGFQVYFSNGKYNSVSIDEDVNPGSKKGGKDKIGDLNVKIPSIIKYQSTIFDSKQSNDNTSSNRPDSTNASSVSVINAVMYIVGVILTLVILTLIVILVLYRLKLRRKNNVPLIYMTPTSFASNGEAPPLYSFAIQNDRIEPDYTIGKK